MSANNWVVCANCIARDKKFRDERLRAANAAYGKVPLEEYERLRAQALTSVPESNPYDDGTLREDYEIGVRDGVFRVSYRCSCEHCGFGYKFKHEERVVENWQKL